MMRASPRGRQLIQKWEQCRLTAYQDIKGIWTIGWGHTGPEVTKGLTWTQEKCDQQFAIDLAKDEQIVNSRVTVPLVQGEFDALVSLVHNIGDEQFMGSTLLKKLNNSDYDGAAAEFPKWDHANHKVVAGLTNRRREEQAIFEVV